MSLPLPALVRRHSSFGRSDGRHSGVPQDKQVIPYKEPSAGKSILVQRVKALQRSSTDAKHTWWKFCRWNGKADFDPARHDAGFLEFFITTYENEKNEKAAARATSAMTASMQNLLGGSSSSSSSASLGVSSSGTSVNNVDGPAASWSQGYQGGCSLGSDSQGGCGLNTGNDFSKTMLTCMSTMVGMMQQGMMMAQSASGKGGASNMSPAGSGLAMNLMGLNSDKLEFGIMARPPPDLVNQKRSASSMAPAPAGGGLMTEEQAREFQKSLKRSRSS